MNRSFIWRQAQAEELNCWVQISPKLNNPRYIELKKAYWRRLLAKSGLSPEMLAATSVIEVGAGPSGIFMLFPHKMDFVSLDPLNDEYSRLVPHLYHQQTIISAPLETYATDQTYDLVFAINCMDHSKNIELFIARLAALCGEGGTAVVAVNCHQTRWSEWIWQRFQSILEPHHPYHFTEASYARLLSKRFTILQVVDIEEDVIWINNETNDAKIPPINPPAQPTTARWRRLLQGIVSGRAVGLLFLRLLAWLGWPAHDFAGNGRSLYRHKLFLLKPRL